MKFIGKLGLRLWRWKVVGEVPAMPKCVLIFAPHTSNWDVLLLLLLKWQSGLKPTFIGKHTLFWPPLSWFFRAIGGEPVNRNKAQNVVEQIVEKFNNKEHMHFALSPEGTRSKKDHWKTGFYRVAIKAGVPIQTVFLDTTTREVGFGPVLEPSGNIEQDFEWLAQFYQTKKGFRPELLSDIRVNSENNKNPS
ncbi:MAG: lysophospholipid acyltransferase family protein [Gammaproteobacteria bacterium]|nr:lysophospholipid acyltransferase family protein [Gammaproteobacteria bacterium]NVK87786.1 lysophospholipid acyltransferase family protein [Gammaproteobacteria bacterium]